MARVQSVLEASARYALLFLCAVGVGAQERPDPRTELPRIARELLAAVAAGDRGVWDRHLADDGVFTDERGVRRTKAELLEAL